MMPIAENQKLTSHSYEPGWSKYLLLAGASTTFGLSIPVGYNIGVVNTPAEILKSFCNESIHDRYDVYLSSAQMNILWSSVVSIFIVGGCIGSIVGAVLADKLGRKKATLVTGLLSVVGAACFLFCRPANSVELMILGRLLVGLASGLTTSIVPMYLTELSPPRLSGAMGVACPMGVNTGVLISQVISLQFILGNEQHWQYLLSVYALLILLSIPVIIMLPESPKYLYVIKKEKELAIRELSKLRGVSESLLTEDLNSLREERSLAEQSDDTNWSMWRVAGENKFKLILLLACSMQAGQQTSGINAVFYYSDTIFKSAGLSNEQAQYATIGCGFINVCTAILMVYLLPKMGRRVLLLSSTLCAAVLLTCLGVAMKLMAIVSWMSVICVIAVLAYVLVYGFGLGPIPYFIASELFEVGPRPAGMAWGSLANWGGNFLVGMSFPSLDKAIGPYSFLIFAFITTILFIFQRRYFPETRGKTPAQVTEICSRGFRSRPTSAAV